MTIYAQNAYAHSEQLSLAGFNTTTTTQVSNTIPTNNKHSKVINLADYTTPINPSIKVNKPIIDRGYKDIKKKETNPVDAFSPKEIHILLGYLLNTPSRYKKTNIRNYLYITLSVNLARRAGDILTLRVADVLNTDGTLKTHISFREQKTDKFTRVYINSYCQQALIMFFKIKGVYHMSDYLFPKYTNETPMEVGGMRKMLQRLVEKILTQHPEYKQQGVFTKHYGTHSLRKTISRNVVDNATDTKDITLTSKFLAHSDLNVTYRYLNIQQEELDDFSERYGIGSKHIRSI